ncbi:MAG: CheB methylesterase domain-containing protein, partial [Defluviitaleaceae bacterium]|nr:CheB methylesterase domain-containing protein [Defluviitaleaceae bacterium]
RLRTDSKIESVGSVLGLMSVQAMVGAHLSNVMIVDLDECSATEAYLRQLAEKNKLYTILTSLSPHKGAPFKPTANRTYIQKPRSFAEVYVEAFIVSIGVKVRDFSASMPALNYQVMQKTVDTNSKIIAIASSTGGTEALEKVLKKLPADIAPILIVQHMPSGFTKFFADRLDKIVPMAVSEAKDNDYLQKGLALIAPADKHMRMVRRGSKLMVECFAGQKLHGVMPAADILFESIAPIMRQNVVGVILTGMGADGARGMLLMHNAGAKTIGQDKESCVVYGMPKVAADLGALDMQLPLDRIADAILRNL